MALNPRQEKFCQLYHESGNACDTYRQAYDCEEGKAISNAWRLKQNEAIQKRLEELEGETRQLCSLSRSEIVDKLAGVILSTPDDVSQENPLCEVKATAIGPVPLMPDKLACIKELNRMMGNYEPEKLEVTADDEVKDMLRELTGARKE